MKNKKIVALPLIVIAALATIGFAYALLSQTLTIQGTVTTGELDWEIHSPTWNDEYGNDYNASYYPELGSTRLTKDIGSTNVTLLDSDGDGDYDSLLVNLTNVYPWYYTHVAFKAHCTGNIPIKIWKVVFKVNDQVKATIYSITDTQATVLLDLNNDGKNDVQIWWGDNFGVQLHKCQSADMSFDITVLQECPKGTTLTFTIELMAIQWNEYENNVPP